MKIGDKVEVQGRIGRFAWKDNPWIDPRTGKDSDILVKVEFEKEHKFFRFSELKKYNSKDEQNQN